jgi:hypothetical protein
MNAQIRDRRDREIQLKRRPVATAVPRYEHSQFSACEQQIAAHVVLTHNSRKRIAG